jgi:Mor family transcriptional regulator
MAETLTLPEGYPDLLGEIAQVVWQNLREVGIGADLAQQAAFATAEGVRREFGGQQPYIPIGVEFALSDRDKSIYARWNGRNGPELCREYTISARHLGRIVAAMRERDRRSRQGNLPL